MNNASPLFSIMVPTYNQAAFLDQCLASIAAQSDPDWEAVVVDDGSTDDTPLVLEAWQARDQRMRAIRQDNGGTAAALNTALANCRGRFVCWLSSDDLFEPQKLAVHRQALAAHAGIRFFHTHFHYLDEATGKKTAPDLWRPIPEPGLQVARFFSGNYVSGITVCIERQSLLEAGPFRQDLRHGQDFALWLELSRRYRSHFIPERTAVTRWHAGQTTSEFPVRGLYDSAWALLEFLNAHDFAGLFPALDLEDPDQAAIAVREVLQTSLDTASFLHQVGYSPALLLRFLEWAHAPAGGPAREKGARLLHELATPEVLATRPAAIQEMFHFALNQRGPCVYIPEPVEAFIVRTIARQDTDPVKRLNLQRYMEARDIACEPPAMKSNLRHWQALQDTGYFDNHPCYRREDGSLLTDAEDHEIIGRYLRLEDKRRVAVIGCGFGRETAVIAPRVGHVWGVDVSPRILEKAVKHLEGRGIENFTPVLAERWKQDLPDDLDFVYCYIVFQHLTRDLVYDYVTSMPARLAPGGEMLCQFADMRYGTRDAGLDHAHEPSVRWNRQDIEALVDAAGMQLFRLDRQPIPEHGDWWWAHFGLPR